MFYTLHCILSINFNNMTSNIFTANRKMFKLKRYGMPLKILTYGFGVEKKHNNSSNYFNKRLLLWFYRRILYFV